MKPFVKWVGGKTQLLKSINELLPDEIDGNYFEPFIGGGAVYLNVRPGNSFISDMNEELIIAWQMIKEKPLELYKKLISMLEIHNEKGKEYFLEVRSWETADLSLIEIAARFIYLNKTCFNGLYRVNRSNKFNVPFNGKVDVKESTIVDKENILNISKFLNETNNRIELSDFSKVLANAKKGDFVFVDPPYDSDTQTFDSYLKDPFGKEGQKRLSEVLHELDDKGVKWMLTNHDTKLIRELYKKYNFNVVSVNRSVNSNGANRKNATTEVIVTNY